MTETERQCVIVNDTRAHGVSNRRNSMIAHGSVTPDLAT